jgi:capsular polysaccharide biosynthesis protein
MEGTLHPLRSFYRRYLSRYLWARKIKPFVLQTYYGCRHLQHVVVLQFRYFLHAMVINLPEKFRFCTLFFTMVTLEKYSKDKNSKTYMLTASQSVVFDMPEVYPAYFKKRLHAGSLPLATPSVNAIEIHNAEVMGKCDFVFTQSLCLHHNFYNWERDFTAEEMYNMIYIDIKRHWVLRNARKKNIALELDQAISLIGGSSGNYIHWLTEIAPKLALFDQVDILKTYPLIIDANLPSNILESLNYLNMYKRKIVQVERGQLCKVRSLVSITPVTYVPFDYRRGFVPGRENMDPSWAMFVPGALYALRERLLSQMKDGSSDSRGLLYIRRNSQFRRIRNVDEVEALIREFGFQVIEPEMLSFTEQVRLFSGAEIIIAQAGAALGNIIFAPHGCRIIILSTWSPHSIYYYFSNLASIFGQKCTYVLSETDGLEDGTHPAHRELKVDIKALKGAIG